MNDYIPSGEIPVSTGFDSRRKRSTMSRTVTLTVTAAAILAFALATAADAQPNPYPAVVGGVYDSFGCQ